MYFGECGVCGFGGGCCGFLSLDVVGCCGCIF